jgi:hypothetical protein
VFPFFGLPSDAKVSLVLEPAFLLMYYCGFTYSETYTLPISYKRWFIERLSKELKAGKDSESAPTRAAHVDTPEVRALRGNTRSEMPSRLRRFT